MENKVPNIVVIRKRDNRVEKKQVQGAGHLNRIQRHQVHNWAYWDTVLQTFEVKKPSKPSKPQKQKEIFAAVKTFLFHRLFFQQAVPIFEFDKEKRLELFSKHSVFPWTQTLIFHFDPSNQTHFVLFLRKKRTKKQKN